MRELGVGVPGDVVTQAQEALEGITEGPWKVVEDHDHMSGITTYRLPRIEQYKGYFNDVHCGTDRPLADFIAAARSLIPELVAEIQDLRTEAAFAKDGMQVRPMTDVESNLMTQVLNLRRQLGAVRKAHDDYEAALYRREHGAIAADHFIRAVSSVMAGLPSQSGDTHE